MREILGVRAGAGVTVSLNPICVPFCLWGGGFCSTAHQPCILHLFMQMSLPLSLIRTLSNRLAQGLLSSRPWSWHPISGGGGQHWALCVSFKSSSAPGHRYHAPAAVAPQLASRHGAVSYQWPHRLPVTGKQFSIELWLYLAQDGLCKGKKEFFFFFL